MQHQITGHTRLLGILADPIHHVKTPQGINDLLVTRGADWVLVPMHVTAQNLPLVVAGLRLMDNLDGFVVTVPHKIAITSLCDELTPSAIEAGAANVVRRTDEGRLIGTLLDGDGFVEGLRSQEIEPRAMSAYIAGAGGAARAIAFALARAGARRVTIANRTTASAQMLAAAVHTAYPETETGIADSDPTGHDLVVNATSLGLRTDDALPLAAEKLHSSQIVAEIIMDPAETPLLAEARARGCRTHAGAPMLACQIALMADYMGVPAA